MTGIEFFFDCNADIFFERVIDHTVARLQNICMPKSACVSCCRPSTSTDKERNGFLFEDNGWSTIQRAVAAESFDGSSKGLFETVLGSGEKRERKTCVGRGQKKLLLGLKRRLHLY